MDDQDNKPEESQQLGFFHVVVSVLAAAIGVQSKKNQQKDFSNKNSIFIYIAAGIIFTALFVLAVYGTVSLVLATP